MGVGAYIKGQEEQVVQIKAGVTRRTYIQLQ